VLVQDFGPGFELMKTVACGVCSTDLARCHLPFPLPQILGHELVAEAADGSRRVVEINAGALARALLEIGPFEAAGLPTHAAKRMVLGIDRLPGGFGPYVLAPVHGSMRVPENVPTETAALIEPFAAALHAVRTSPPIAGDRVAVLGPRRLGLLVCRARASERQRLRIDFEIAGIGRSEVSLERALAFGADRAIRDTDASERSFDLVFDCTGNPDALPFAVSLAKRELHMKSTHGLCADGVQNWTAFVVDELQLRRLPRGATEFQLLLDERSHCSSPPTLAWPRGTPPPRWLEEITALHADSDAASLLAEASTPDFAGSLPCFDFACCESAAKLDSVIRPKQAEERALVRPRGCIFLTASPSTGRPSRTLDAVAERGLILSSSRCGSFQAALDCFAIDPSLRQLGKQCVSARFPATELPAAFEAAKDPRMLKILVEHGDRSCPDRVRP